MGKRTLAEIKADVSKLRGLRPEKQVTRGDILEILEYYKDPQKEKENVRNFLDSIESGILNEEQKEKILDDLENYPTSYRVKEKREAWMKELKEKEKEEGLATLG